MCLNIVNLSLIFLLVLDPITVNGNRGHTCTPLKQCLSFLKYYKSLERPLQESNVEFLRSMQCGFQDGFVKVWCEDDSKIFESPHPSKESISTKCDSKQCVNLKSCVPFMRFLSQIEKPLKMSVVNFLRAQECGFENNFPKVCCKPVPQHIRNLKHFQARPEPSRTMNSATDEKRTTIKVWSTTPKVHVLPKEPTKMYKDKFNLSEFSVSDLFDDQSFDLFVRHHRSSVSGSYLDVEIR